MWVINMNQKRFTFDDEYEEVSSQFHNDIQYENNLSQKEQTSLHSQPKVSYKKPKTKIKKKTKTVIKKKRPQKIIKERKRSWFSTLLLFLLSILIIAGLCAGTYIAYNYYTKQQAQIDQLQQQLQESQQQPTPPPVTNPPVEDQTQTPDTPNQDESQQTPDTPDEEIPENQKRTQN